jgi:hypothetical protein
MICNVCGRLTKSMVTKWHECEEFREYDHRIKFCPNCGTYYYFTEESTHVLRMLIGKKLKGEEHYLTVVQ